MAIINSILGHFVTMKHPGVARLESEVRRAESEFQEAVSSGRLLRKDGERQALAEDLEVTLNKYVENYDGPVADGDEKLTEKKTRVALGDGLELMPFADEIAAEIHALSTEPSVSEWIVEPEGDEAAFDNVWMRVVSNAREQVVYDEGRVLGAKGSRPNVPWHGEQLEAALNAVFAPLYDAVRAGDDPEEVRKQVTRSMALLFDGARDLTLIRLGRIVVSLRRFIAEARRDMARMEKNQGAWDFFNRHDTMRAEAKRQGRGGIGFFDRLSYRFGRNIGDAVTDSMARAPIVMPQ